MRDTKQRVLDAAERLFAERGYHATSLRAITTKAGVNLAAVNYHFSSKDALIQAVFARRLRPLNERRLALLDSYEADNPKKAVPLEKLVYALIEPVLRLKRNSTGGVPDFSTLLGRIYSEPTSRLQQMLSIELGEILRRFVEAFRRSLPGLPLEELFWRVHFSIGAMAHTVAANTLLEEISDGRCRLSNVDRTAERLVAFIVAGLKAPLPPASKSRREKPADGAASGQPRVASAGSQQPAGPAAR